MSFRKPTKSIIVGAVAVAVTGGTYGFVSATAGNGSTVASSALIGGPKAGGVGPNARSGPAAGGTVGKVDTVSSTGFTLTTSTGQKVTVDKTSATTYEKGTSATTPSAVTTREPVIVLGTTSGTTITATQVTVETAGSAGAANASAAKVVAFKRGAPATSQQVGQIPANYIEGSGTIVGGTAADKATEAALAAYPGGIVDRVVKLGNGQYEVHYIGVNWPHHIFVNQNFTVIGAD